MPISTLGLPESITGTAETYSRKGKMHISITTDRIIDAIERQETNLDNPGFCLDCGAESNSCEPDAREYKCDECDHNQVFGAEEILMEFL